jgi:DNA-binding beta-propeller fold protein YncE
LYLADLDANRVIIVDPERRAVIARIADVPRPSGLAVAPDGRTVYAGGEGRAVTAIDASTHSVRRIESGAAPHAVDVSSDGRALFAANAKDQTLSMIGIPSGRLLARPRVGALPIAVAAIPRRPAVYVVN